MFLFITFTICIILGLIGSSIAKEKNRDWLEGFAFGFFLSVFGLIIIAVLPTKEKVTRPSTQIFQKEIIRTVSTYNPEKVKISESKSVNTVIWLILLVVLIMTIVLVGITSNKNEQKSTYPDSDVKLNSVFKTDENSKTKFGPSNEKEEELPKSRVENDKSKVRETKTSGLTKEDKVILLSKVFDSVYGKDLSYEIARSIYNENIKIDSISYFKIENDKRIYADMFYKKIELYDSKNLLLNSFRNVKIEGFVDFERKQKKQFELELKKKNEEKIERISVLLKKFNLTEDFFNILLRYLGREQKSLTHIEFDSISLSKTLTNFAVINFHLKGEYVESIEFPYPIPSELISKF
jgi:hypothetical protein